jgi:hypothetical protein
MVQKIQYIVSPGIVVKWIKLLLHIQEVLGSNLGPETSYLDRFFVVSSVPPGECWDNPLKLGHYHFHPIHHSFITLSFDLGN